MLSVACRWLARALGRNAPVPGVVTLGGRVRLLVYPTASPNPRPPPPARPGRYPPAAPEQTGGRSEEHTSELQSRLHLVCRLLLEKKKKKLWAYIYKLLVSRTPK